MLVGFTLTHYALFSHLSIGLTQETLDSVKDAEALTNEAALGGLVAIVGPNDSGKSALFGALSFISDCLIHDVPYAAASHGRGGFFALKRRGSEAPMELALTFRLEPCAYATYRVVLDSDQHQRPFVHAESVITTTFGEGSVKTNVLDVLDGHGAVFVRNTRTEVSLADRRHLALGVYGKLLTYPTLCTLYAQITRWLVVGDDTEPDRIIGATRGGHRHLSARFDNIRNVLAYMEADNPERFQKTMDHLRERVPHFKRTGDAFLDHDNTSGSLHLFALMLLLADPKPRPLICLDHPDIKLYHDTIDTLMFEIRDYLSAHPTCQLFLTTYNPSTIEALHPREVYRLPSPSHDGHVKAIAVGQLKTVAAMQRQGVGMASLWYGGYFDHDDDAR